MKFKFFGHYIFLSGLSLFLKHLKTILTIIATVVLAVLAISCSKDEIVLEEEQVLTEKRMKNDKQLLRFEFLVRNNPSLKKNIIGSIKEDDQTIRIKLTDDNIDITKLTPTIKLSHGVEARYMSYDPSFRAPVVHLFGYPMVPTDTPYPIIICGRHDLPCPP